MIESLYKLIDCIQICPPGAFLCQSHQTSTDYHQNLMNHVILTSLDDCKGKVVKTIIMLANKYDAYKGLTKDRILNKYASNYSCKFLTFVAEFQRALGDFFSVYIILLVTQICKYKML